MSDYVGRFAPSPSGPLHMGSLLAALASYLQARQNNGLWLLRIEDIDPPREPPTAAADIINCLSAHGLLHDGPVSYQSNNHERYKKALGQLRQDKRLFACHCTRAQLRNAAKLTTRTAYPGTCQNLNLSEHKSALRLRLSEECQHSFNDELLGFQYEDLRTSCGDFVLRRRDGLYAYQLAVVVDDAAQSVSEVVRGADLLDNTARQIHLQNALCLPCPQYFHVPILLDDAGNKLSKQNHAPALDNSLALENLVFAWAALGQETIECRSLDVEAFLKQATKQWKPWRIQLQH